MPYHSPNMTEQEYKMAVDLLGPWMIGLIIDMILYGIFVSQQWSYFTYYKDDKLWFKSVVYGLGVVHFLKTIHSAATNYIQFVLWFTDLPGAINLSYTVWWQIGFTLIDAATSAYVQIYLIYRLYIVSRQWKYLSWIFVVSISAVLAFSFIFVCVATRNIAAADFTHIASWYAGHYAGVVVTDVLIAAATAYSLLKTKKNVMPQTHNVLSALTKLAVQCAIPPAIFAIINLAFSQAYDGTQNLTSQIFNQALPRLYAVTMMYVINTRKHIVRAHGMTTSNSQTGQTHKTGRVAGRKRDDLELGGVQVRTETTTHVDLPKFPNHIPSEDIDIDYGTNSVAPNDKYTVPHALTINEKSSYQGN
ncbi:hypothetical protein BT69DRAFT_1354809 [Atractiella rhizophila]|nr:hypothetical protein BT69DRAFT_1354809 [Atractiella rhizophila]